MDYVIYVLILAAFYSVMAISLDLVAGQLGLLSMAQAAFAGLGAYTSALLAVHCGTSFPVGVAAGMLIAAAFSFIVSLPSLRLHGDYFVIATFGFQMIVFSIFNNWTEVTHGPLGVAGISRPIIFGWTVDSSLGFLGLAVGVSAVAHIVVFLVVSSPFGRVLHAVREDENFARSFGKNPLYFKVTTFALSAALAALAGSFYAHYITFIDPPTFSVAESILVIAMVIIGGAGSFLGPLTGATLLVALPELLRFVGLPAAIAANVRQVIYGILLVAMMMARSRGLIGRYGFRR